MNDSFEAFVKKNRPQPPNENLPMTFERIWRRIQSEPSRKSAWGWAPAFALPALALLAGIWVVQKSELPQERKTSVVVIEASPEILSSPATNLLFELEDEESLSEIENFAALGL